MKTESRWSCCRALTLALGAASLAFSLIGCAQPRKPNVIVFVVDMLRPDHLGIYGYPKNTSPNLDRVARKGVIFDHAFSAAPWTLPSTVSLLTGLLPSEHGATRKIIDQKTQVITFPSDPDIWLPRIFKENGYATVGFHTHQYLRRDVSNIFKAFDEYYYPPAEHVKLQQYTQGSAPWTQYMYLDTLYPACEKWLEKNSKKAFFMYIHVIDVHGPYSEIRLLDQDEAFVRRGLADGSIEFQKMPQVDMYSPTDTKDPYKFYLYDGQIHYMDAYLGSLMSKLEELGISRDTYVVFAADHGEEFGEHHDYWGHGKYLYNTQISVPLVLLSHANLKDMPRRITNHVNTVGLLPTMAEIVGIKVGQPYSGRSFSSLLVERNEPRDWRYLSVNETARAHGLDAITIDGRFKLITDLSTEQYELFDLQDDPREIHPVDLQGLQGEQAGRFRELLALRRALEERHEAKELGNFEMDPATLDALKTLGYTE